MKLISKKLSLRKKIVMVLTDKELTQVKGGATSHLIMWPEPTKD